MARPLVLCHFSAIDVAPPAFVDLAARAGFTAVSLMLEWPRTYPRKYPLIGRTRMRRETRHRLDETGLILLDAATCRLEHDTVVDDFRPMLESAAYLGARSVTVEGNDTVATRLQENFTKICLLAGDHGLSVGVEFMMSTQVRTLSAALGLVEVSGAANAAVTIDSLHLARSGGTPSDVAAVRADQIAYVQLSDAPLEQPAQGFAREAVGGRLLPGQGQLPVRALVDAVGTDVPLGVEAPSISRIAEGVSDDDYAAAAMRALLNLTDGR